MKPFIFSLLFALLSTMASAQQVSKNIPVTDKRSDLARDIVQVGDVDDEFILLVSCNCKDTTILVYCLALLRIDQNGEVIWKHIFDGSPHFDLRPTGPTLVLLNDTIFVANHIQKGSKKEIRLMSFDMDGNVLNEMDYYVPYDDFFILRGMMEVNQKLLVYGYIRSGTTRKIFILELNTQLELLSEHFFGEPRPKQRAHLTALKNNAGYLLSYIEIYERAYVMLKKLDNDFNVLSTQKILRSREYYGAVNAYESADDGYIVVWNKDLSDSVWHYIFQYPTTVFKLNEAAETEWEFMFLHSTMFTHVSAKMLDDSLILVTGTSDYFWGQDLLDNYSAGWIFLMDVKNGNLVWERHIADPRNSYNSRGWNGLRTESGSFILVGDINMENPTGVPFLNDPDVWFVTLDENGCWNGNCNKHIVITSDSTSETITSTDDAVLPEAVEPKLILYPNPTSNMLTIEYESRTYDTSRHVEVFNINGQKVMEHELRAPKSTLYFGMMQPGIYFISHFEEGHLIETHRIIVQH